MDVLCLTVQCTTILPNVAIHTFYLDILKHVHGQLNSKGLIKVGMCIFNMDIDSPKSILSMLTLSILSCWHFTKDYRKRYGLQYSLLDTFFILEPCVETTTEMYI